MNNKKNIIILGGNSINNVKWIEEMCLEYKNEYNILTIQYDNWVTHKDIDIIKELEKLKKVVSKNKKYIIIAKSIGMILAIKAINQKIINSNLAVFMGFPLKFMKKNEIETILDEYQQIKITTKCLFIQQENDKFCDKNEFIKVLPNEYLISIEGCDHAYNNIKEIKQYINKYIEINNNFNVFNKVKGKNIDDVIAKINKQRNKYKYQNNWLSNANKKILSFNFNNKNYIAKRTTLSNANVEIQNAKILKEKLKLLKGEYRFIVKIPVISIISKKYCYIITEYYGCDLNQEYYDDTYVKSSKFDAFIKKSINYLLDNNILYNGFIPRNVILKNNKIYLIDFEDLNKKSKIAVETTMKIGWSYFINIDNNLNSEITLTDEFSKEFYNNDLLEYKNPYFVALVGESKQDNNYKFDDIINVLSQYLDMHLEVFLDIVLYEIENGNIDEIIKTRICILSYVIRIIELLKSKHIVKKIVLNELLCIIDLIKKVQNKKCQKYLNNIKETIYQKIEVGEEIINV